MPCESDFHAALEQQRTESAASVLASQALHLLRRLAPNSNRLIPTTPHQASHCLEAISGWKAFKPLAEGKSDSLFLFS